MINLLTLPVLLPIFGAAVALALPRRPRLQRSISILSLSGVVLVAAILIRQTDSQGTVAFWVAGWDDALGIVLVADRLSALMLFVASVVALSVLLFAQGQDEDEVRRETPVSIFHPTFLLLIAGVANAFLAGDLFNLFVGFEMLLFASYVLLTLGGTADRIRAGTTYTVVSLLSSALFLTAIAAIYGATGTVNLAQLSVRLADLTQPVQLLLQLMLLVVFAIKAAVFPLSAWLPDSYPTAPAPVTAVFAGLLTKVGIYAIIRTQTLLFPDSPLSEILLVAALLTMLIGILGAVAQVEIKRMLSFTLVSHLGYMVMGVALANDAGLAATIYYTAHHITIQAALFLVAGLIERRGGTTHLDGLGGLMKAAPFLAVLFLVPAMNLGGIPPMSGFIGKLGLLSAGAQLGTPLAWIVMAGGVATSLLTLMAMAKVWNRAFWGVSPQEREASDAAVAPVPGAPASDAGEQRAAAVAAPGVVGVVVEDEEDLAQEIERHKNPMPPLMAAATTGLILFSLALTVFAGPLYDYAARAADGLRDGSYVAAVLPEGER
ncbi:Na+/H+ antiporter subunit D [Tessaracoccus sp. OS52]|uniref:Na+/H+ antiporter subunit D n=1 Tax=Tessaracoccus sp. OS52 TaxID=2886691 RepID=UPI001D1109AB|nr:Na+/H+ antiporter subunit D [Tessaracoccus sp. OS52]MCC2593975.1 Na+/H+ antiporter subunit D [Tessaracoccus sp. OS52]